ncbi:MAG: serine hydrolase, partial [Candidatus Rokuibacteriota bacterium]
MSDAFAAAIEYHRSHETRWRRDFLTDDGRYIGVADEPAAVGDVLGPVLARGGPNGVIRRGGEIVAEWGESERVDMSFSIAKSYLSVLAGLALARGLIRNVDDR